MGLYKLDKLEWLKIKNVSKSEYESQKDYDSGDYLNMNMDVGEYNNTTEDDHKPQRACLWCLQKLLIWLG